MESSSIKNTFFKFSCLFLKFLPYFLAGKPQNPAIFEHFFNENGA